MRSLRLGDLERTDGEYCETFDSEGLPLYLFWPAGGSETIDVTLLTLAAKRDAAWHRVAAAVDAVAVADREAGSQAYRCGVLVHLGAPRSLIDRFMESFSRRLEDAIQSGTVGPFDGWQPTPLVSAFPPRSMPNSEARKRLEEGRRPPAAPEPVTYAGDYGADLPILTCRACGHTGEGVMYYYQGRISMCGRTTAKACLDRIQEARACLEPVTQA